MFPTGFSTNLWMKSEMIVNPVGYETLSMAVKGLKHKIRRLIRDLALTCLGFDDFTRKGGKAERGLSFRGITL